VIMLLSISSQDHHWRKELKLAIHVKRKTLEVMNANLLNHLQVPSKQNVQYAAGYSVTHANLPVVAPASVKHASNNSNLTKISVQCAGKATFLSFQTWD